MKIAAILTSKVSSGGGFNQTLNAIIQMSRLCNDKYELTVYTDREENIPHLNSLKIDAHLYQTGIVESWLSYSATNPYLRKLQSKIRLISGLEKQLISAKVDLVYFLDHNHLSLSLQKIRYIATAMDLCHRDSPEFPEVSSFNEFIFRDFLFSQVLPQAVLVVCDSPLSAEKIGQYYGVQAERLLVMPFEPSPFIGKQTGDSTEATLHKYNLEPGYFFYPAQFWAHKNHARILQAMKKLKDQHSKVRKIVFCGTDMGNLSHIQDLTSELGLAEDVRFLGFVPAEDIGPLYEGSAAVVMPSYFGPTNIPPLEAWSHGKPLIYSSHLSDQARDAALLVDPDSVDELSDALVRILDPTLVKELQDNGRKNLSRIDDIRKGAEADLSRHLHRYSQRLSCWKR